MGDSAIEPTFSRVHLRGGLTYGQNTPGAQKIQSAFAEKGLHVGAVPAYGAHVGWGVDIVSTPISKRSLITTSTEIDFGLSVQNASAGGFHKQHVQGTWAQSVAVGYVHNFDNGCYAAGSVRTTYHILGPERIDTGFRLEAGKKLGGMIQVDRQAFGAGQGDVCVTAGIVLNL